MSLISRLVNLSQFDKWSVDLLKVVAEFRGTFSYSFLHNQKVEELVDGKIQTIVTLPRSDDGDSEIISVGNFIYLLAFDGNFKRFDRRSRIWIDLPPHPQSKDISIIAICHLDTCLYMHAYDNDDAIDEIFVYDMQSQLWSCLPRLPVNDFSIINVGDVILACGLKKWHGSYPCWRWDTSCL